LAGASPTGQSKAVQLRSHGIPLFRKQCDASLSVMHAYACSLHAIVLFSIICFGASVALLPLMTVLTWMASPFFSCRERRRRRARARAPLSGSAADGLALQGALADGPVSRRRDDVPSSVRVSASISRAFQLFLLRNLTAIVCPVVLALRWRVPSPRCGSSSWDPTTPRLGKLSVDSRGICPYQRRVTADSVVSRSLFFSF
jgi:hypothetical protein